MQPPLFARPSRPDGVGSSAEWFVAAGTVGITAGTSTPDRGHRSRRPAHPPARRRAERSCVRTPRGATHDAPSRERARWLVVVVFAIGMAWVEAASVYYLRVLVDRIEPYQANPLPMHGVLGQVELVREAATLVMLVTLGMLAGRTRHAQAGLHGDRVRRLGHFLLRVSANDR